jgi:hypothetical protein
MLTRSYERNSFTCFIVKHPWEFRKAKSCHLKLKIAFAGSLLFSSLSKVNAYLLNEYFICSNSQYSTTLILTGRVVTRLWAGWPWFDSLQRQGFFSSPTYPDCLWGPMSLLVGGQLGLFPWGQNGRGM